MNVLLKTSHVLTVSLAGYLLLANGLAYALFRASVGRGARPLPVGRLMFLATLGGSLGANLGLLRFRRALARFPLKGLLRAIFVVQVALVSAAALPVRPALERGAASVALAVIRSGSSLGQAVQGTESGPRGRGAGAGLGVKILDWASGGTAAGALSHGSGGIVFHGSPAK